MKKAIFLLITIFFVQGYGFMTHNAVSEEQLPKAPDLEWTDDPADLGLEAEAVDKAYGTLVRAKRLEKIPGCVAVIGRNGYALEPRPYGYAILEPEKIEMEEDTIFDMASLTKMVATNTSIMILYEDGKIDLDDPVVKYLPEFGAHGKDEITIRQLLTHTGGLPAFIRFYKDIKGKYSFYKAVCDVELKYEPGTDRIYSDIGYKTLGFIVEQASGMDLDEFARERIFEPLDMEHTTFNPPKEWKEKTAATEIWPVWKKLAWGEVHDENANAMGGVAGHAGLFSTADDLSKFCQMLLNGGKLGKTQILKPETVREFYRLQTPPEISGFQGMGWILGSEESERSLGEGSFGHSGFTGTFLYVSPKHNAFAILLTNIIHPDREKADRDAVRVPFFTAVKEALNNAAPSIDKLTRLYPVDEYWVEKTLRQMTLEEKAGHLIMPSYKQKKEVGLEIIKEIKPGGVILWALEDAQFIAEMINEFQQTSDLPLLMSADFERGVGCYVNNATDLPSNMAIGASGDKDVAEEAARITALETRALGVHVNFAPVLDVNNNPLNPIINIRAFGGDPKLVSKMGVAWIKAGQEFGMLCTGKHFPGHGNTATDSHTSLGIIPGDKEQIEKIELYPFEKAIKKADVSSIMTAHLWVQAFDEKPVPATMSEKIMTGVLRNDFDFEGLLFTDAMVMGGVTKELSFEESVIRSIEAGCDVILMPADPYLARDAILNAVKEGRLTEERLDQSIRRILEAKTKAMVHKERFIRDDLVKFLVGTKQKEKTAKELSKECLTLVKRAEDALPLSKEKKTAVILLANQVGNIMVWRDIYNFGQWMEEINPHTESLFVGDEVSDEEKKKSMEIIRNAEQIVVALYPRIVIHRGNVSLDPEQKTFLNEMMMERKPDVLVSFGSPYVLAEIPVIETYLCAFGNANSTQAAVAESLFEETDYPGRLPISITDADGTVYPTGHKAEQ